ncbi:hypothetical protein ACQCLI_18245 [Pseudomonas nitroreducens]|uniref:hypothetical protein n=1 Tax=Pseudomonas nitroreducens TaxID=46680 RepID=UPI0004753322|nr:hypothetical protein [Pseudomonas nitroreducens]
MTAKQELALPDLLDDQDQEFLRELAERLGLTPAQAAKQGIQETIVKRTRPRTMPGTVQPFRRKTE